MKLKLDQVQKWGTMGQKLLVQADCVILRERTDIWERLIMSDETTSTSVLTFLIETAFVRKLLWPKEVRAESMANLRVAFFSSLAVCFL